MKNSNKLSDPPYLDYEDLEDQIEVLWELLESRKYSLVQDNCRTILKSIEQDIADDFGQDIQTATLYEDPHEERRECYLETLQVYQKTLRSLALELILQTDGRGDIEQNFQNYQSLRHEIQGEMDKVAYLLGQDYKSRTFITPSDLEQLDKLTREHCQFILKSEFFEQFKIVIQALGRLDRKDFHKVTEPYKNLRSLCDRCLQILEVMKDGRFFGEKDTFIEDYERDVKIYLQLLWYLAIKTDLNKTDKFLNPNTYSQGLDKNCQVFAAIALLEQVIPHVKEARNNGLSDKAAIILIEEYTEYLYKIITHEEGQIEKEDALYQLRETERIVTDGYSHDYYKDFDLGITEDMRDTFKESYSAYHNLEQMYNEIIQNEVVEYIHQEDFQEFEGILERAAIGVGIKEETLEGKEFQDAQEKPRKVYRYKYSRGTRETEPAVFVIERKLDKGAAIKVLHKKWVEEIYDGWKKFKKLKYLKGLIERYTENQEKIKYRIDFMIKLFKNSRFALRLGRHKRIPFPNPDGRVLRQDIRFDQILEALKNPIFSEFFEELKVQYRSQFGLKLQRLRWSWFAERELPEGYFEKPKYDYLKYIHTRWKEKIQQHYKTLHQLSRRDDDDDDDDD